MPHTNSRSAKIFSTPKYIKYWVFSIRYNDLLWLMCAYKSRGRRKFFRLFKYISNPLIKISL